MQIAPFGEFMFTIGPEELSRGLRPSFRSPRNTKFLVECIGAVGIDNVLQVIEDLETYRIDTSALTPAFPYPQLFIFPKMTIICNQRDIYEVIGGALTHMLGPVTAGYLWTAAEFFDFIYMSNGAISVLRNPANGSYSTSSTQPVASSICNFNGQVIIGDAGV